MPSRKSSAALASSSSILESAKPTWIRTQSPGSSVSPSSRPMLTARLTPLTSTLARSGRSGSSSTTSPGMPRHMASPSSGEGGLGQFPEDVVEGGLRFLDPVDGCRRDHEEVVDGVQLGHLAALVAGEPDGEQAAAGCRKVVATYCASVELPPLPKVSSLAPAWKQAAIALAQANSRLPSRSRTSWRSATISFALATVERRTSSSTASRSPEPAYRNG